MLKGAVSKVMWVGRTTVFLVGLAVILALVFGVVSMLLGTNGDRTSGISRLVGSDAGADQVLNVDPLAMRRQVEVPRGYAQVNVTPTAVTTSGAKGINGVQRSTTDNSIYCFDLKFAPKTAVASANLNNNATVGTVLGSGVPSSCPTGFKDAAARTYAANTSAPLSDINFGIVFI